MLENIIYNFGYYGLFLISLLSSSIFPLSSEPFVILMILLNYNIIIIILIATFGNLLGSIINYYIGKYGDRLILSKYIRKNSKNRKRATKLFNKYGQITLFFSWIPIFGDIFCVIAGMTNMKLKRFLIIVFLGKLFRYLIIMAIIKYFT